MSNKAKLIDITIDRVDFPNKGKGTFEGKEVRFKGGIAGQKVRVNVTKRRKDYWEAKIYEVLESSSLESEKGCAHTGICGGCTYQKLTYENELEIKLNQVKELFLKAELAVQIDGIEP